MVSPRDEAVSFIVPVGPDAPARARREAAARFAPFGTDTSERALLALSELVTNVVRHARLMTGDDIAVSIMTSDDRVRVEVHQPTRVIERSERWVPSLDGGGLGLTIVERVADRWGLEPGPPGRVWFEVR